MTGSGEIMKVNFSFSNFKECSIKYVPWFFLWADLVAIAILCALVLAYLPTQNGDNVEHIHSSFMIALGQVPYRDFFQHHNPLLWYLFAPLTKLFAYDPTISEVVSLISFLVFLKSLVYVYKLNVEFLSNKFWGLAAAAAIATPGYKLYAVDFRPDNYMVFCLIAGIYYLFSYLKEQKRYQISVAFLWFFVGLMFAQKALFPLAVLGVCILYFWKINVIKTNDLLWAMLLPGLGLCSFIGYLWHYDMIELYYLSNYTFNLNLVEGFERGKVVAFPALMFMWVMLGFAGALMGIFSKNKYWLVIIVLFVTEFLQRKFYFSPYSYYYWLLIYFAVLCGVPLLYRLDAKNRIVRFVFVAVVYYFLSKAMVYYHDLVLRSANKPYLPDYISRRITPCDYVFNGDGMMYNIFGKDPAYYWQLIGQLDVIGEKTKIRPRPNINNLIAQLKPKFIFGRSYFNKFSSESGHPQVIHYVDLGLVNRYYQPTPFSVVYMLKPEYDKRKCLRDEATGVWQYQE